MGHSKQCSCSRVSSCQRSNLRGRWWSFRRSRNIRWGGRARQRNREFANWGAKSAASASRSAKSKPVAARPAKSPTIAAGLADAGPGCTETRRGNESVYRRIHKSKLLHESVCGRNEWFWEYKFDADWPGFHQPDLLDEQFRFETF